MHFEHTLNASLNVLSSAETVVERSYARIGLMGNPSDGFNGRTVAMLLGNYHAEVVLRPSEKLSLVRHPEHDPTEFNSLMDYYRYTSLNGYYGGLRLLQAVCKKFAECCAKAEIPASRLKQVGEVAGYCKLCLDGCARLISVPSPCTSFLSFLHEPGYLAGSKKLPSHLLSQSLTHLLTHSLTPELHHDLRDQHPAHGGTLRVISHNHRCLSSSPAFLPLVHH